MQSRLPLDALDLLHRLHGGSRSPPGSGTAQTARAARRHPVQRAPCPTDALPNGDALWHDRQRSIVELEWHRHTSRMRIAWTGPEMQYPKVGAAR